MVPPFVVETLTGSSAAGIAPSANSRLPVPMITGWMVSRYSSTRPCRTRVGPPRTTTTCVRPRWTPPRAPALRQYDLVAHISETHDGAADRVRTRLVAFGAAMVTVAAGLGLRAGVSGDVAKYGGDALYTVLLLTLVVLVAPRVTRLKAAGGALAVSCAVEFLQLSQVPAELAQRSTLARLVLGSTFNAIDLFWYAVGAVMGCLIHATVGSLSSRRGRGHARRGYSGRCAGRVRRRPADPSRPADFSRGEKRGRRNTYR